jgi:hypothetical protein
LLGVRVGKLARADAVPGGPEPAPAPAPPHVAEFTPDLFQSLSDGR